MFPRRALILWDGGAVPQTFRDNWGWAKTRVGSRVVVWLLIVLDSWFVGMVDVRKLFLEDEGKDQDDDGNCDENETLRGHDLLE